MLNIDPDNELGRYDIIWLDCVTVLVWFIRTNLIRITEHREKVSDARSVVFQAFRAALWLFFFFLAGNTDGH